MNGGFLVCMFNRQNHLGLYTSKNNKIVLIGRGFASNLGRQGYEKPTNTNLYLNNLSHHHPAPKFAVLSTLVKRARSVADPESLSKELDFLRTTFLQNGYNHEAVNRALRKPLKEKCSVEENAVKATVKNPFCNTIAGRLSHLLKSRNRNSFVFQEKSMVCCS